MKRVMKDLKYKRHISNVVLGTIVNQVCWTCQYSVYTPIVLSVCRGKLTPQMETLSLTLVRSGEKALASL